MSKIVKVEAIPLVIRDPAADSLDGTTDTLLVRLTDQDGRAGIGECDAPPEATKAFIEMPTAHFWSESMARLLIGADPVEIGALWQRLYENTIYSARRGIGIHALSGIDIALHDLAGKQLGLPAYKLMGGARRDKLRPYCTIYPGLATGGQTVRDLMAIIERQLEKAIALGFRAVKMEVVFFDLATDAELVDLIKEGRRMVGDDITLALDFGYRWHSWHDARWVLDRVADCNIYFAEATLQHDDLLGHAKLSQASPIRICGAELAATRWEIREWIETGKVSVVQPDISRCGGLTEIRRIADMCELHGVEVIPHAWKTGILAQAGRHFQAACPAAPYFEFISPRVYDSPLRRDLVSPEPVVRDGYMELPTGVGLGLELNEETVERYRIDR
ncbi:MAG: mandelate racemase/muconate lactonizing enzyme family protein [Dongiaceae bacterium]